MIRRLFGPKVVETLPALRRYALALTRDAAAAEDLVQDALLLACERRNSLRDESRLRPWLLSILHNRFISDVRRREAEQARNALVQSDQDHISADIPQEVAMRLAEVDRAFRALPADQRAVLHLIAVEGLSYDDTAQALGVPVGTVMSRLHRARAALRRQEDGVRRIPARPQPPRLKIVGGDDE